MSTSSLHIPPYDRLMQKEMEETVPGTKLLLHVCCGPCSTAVLERLGGHFSLGLFFYNPNIWPPAEYQLRYRQLQTVLDKLNTRFPVVLLSAPYEPKEFDAAAAGLELEREGGLRCSACFALRLEHAAKTAAQLGYGWYTTTLSVSPHKDALQLNAIGEEMGRRYGVRHLPADFKKRDGYRRSVALSAALGLYRQNYCGCQYSLSGKEEENQGG